MAGAGAWGSGELSCASAAPASPSGVVAAGWRAQKEAGAVLGQGLIAPGRGALSFLRVPHCRPGHPPPPCRHHPTAWRHLEQANGLQRSSLQRHPAEADEALLKVCPALPLLPLHCPWEYISAHTAAWPSTRCFVCVCPWWPRLPLPPPLPGGQTQCLCVHLHALLLPTCAR